MRKRGRALSCKAGRAPLIIVNSSRLFLIKAGGIVYEHIDDHLISSKELSMFSTLHTQPRFHAWPRAIGCCTHSRMIADVLTPQGLKTGTVRCLECGAVFAAPALSSETHGGG